MNMSREGVGEQYVMRQIQELNTLIGTAINDVAQKWLPLSSNRYKRKSHHDKERVC